MTEPWLRGEILDLPPVVLPAAHALIQAAEDIPAAVGGLSAEQTWMTPGGAASIGFHLRHVTGSIDRLRTYAGGEALSDVQLAALAREGMAGTPPPAAGLLTGDVTRAIEHGIGAMRAEAPSSYFQPRFVGRRRLPTTVLGLLFHIAEHTQRHAGQIIATAKFVRSAGDRAAPP